MQRALIPATIGIVAVVFTVDAKKKYQFLHSAPYTNVPEFDKGRALVDYHLRNPKTGDKVVLVPLPSTQTLKFYGQIAVDLWNLPRSNKNQLPIMISPGIRISDGPLTSIPVPPNTILLEQLASDVQKSFYDHWKAGTAQGNSGRILASVDDALFPTISELGFPSINGDVAVDQLSTLTKVYLLNTAGSSLGPDLDSLPKDSPLWGDLVEKRVASALSTLESAISGKASQQPIKTVGVWTRLLETLRLRSKPDMAAISVGGSGSRTFVLPWQRRHCPGLLHGLQQAGYEVVEQRERSVPQLPFFRFLARQMNRPFHSLPGKAQIDAEIRAKHDKLIQDLTGMIEFRKKELGPYFEGKLRAEVTEHLRLSSVIDSINILELEDASSLSLTEVLGPNKQ